jgi:hypothetical protein
MADEIKTGTVLIKEDALLPEALHFECESCVPGWRLVKHLSGDALGRKIHEAGWTFFFQAGEIKSTVFGIDAQQMARRAIEQVLRDPRSKKFNCLEIMRVTSLGSGRFPGVLFLTVTANLRHVQEGLFLFRAADILGSRPNRTANGDECRPNQEPGRTGGNRLRKETSRQPGLVAVLNP